MYQIKSRIINPRRNIYIKYLCTYLQPSDVIYNTALNMLCVIVVAEVINDGTAAKQQAIQKDLEAGRRLLLQMQEHFNKVEAKVSQLHVSLP